MITEAQKARAQEEQLHAAHDDNNVVRVIAGPGTGKTYTIQEKVNYVLSKGLDPGDIYVISFTRATCAELKERIVGYCMNGPNGEKAISVKVSTMHSLALGILRKAGLLTDYPSGIPIMLDNWEQIHIYNYELSTFLGCTPTRADQIRLAYDAAWQTLDSSFISQAAITEKEKKGFRQFHESRTNLYSCVLPGEIINKCVNAIKNGSIQQGQLPKVEQLIVDEFQDLNKCDQEFVKLLHEGGAKLFVVGDDDQSIYSFRHANPDGIINFKETYKDSTYHELADCFRCTPAILEPAKALIRLNPKREPKSLNSLYSSSEPPVEGGLYVWSFDTPEEEAKAISISCQRLIETGMEGQENQILILIKNRRQLDLITKELGNLGLDFEQPEAENLTTFEPIRAIYSILRILKENKGGIADYPAHRVLVSLLSGIGEKTQIDISEACIANLQNYHDLFYLESNPKWLSGKGELAINRIKETIQVIRTWDLEDTLEMRKQDISNILSKHIFVTGKNVESYLSMWKDLAEFLPSEMTLNELLEFLSASNEEEQEIIIEQVGKRIGLEKEKEAVRKKIRILTMHGSKGLSGKVVFIPSANQGIMPSAKEIYATGKLIESRRLFYVSLTRAKAACIISHATTYKGQLARALAGKQIVRLSRSRFLNDMDVKSNNKKDGLSYKEAEAILNDINNL